jgi:hypothetical protein
MNRILSILVLLAGLVGVLVGVIFVFEGVSKNTLIVDRMAVENITLAIDPGNPTQVTNVMNADDAQKTADLIASHRRKIAPSYQALLGGKPFNSSNTTQLTYAQAMNLENYLYLAVTAFGLIQVVMAAGAFMIVTGIGLVLTGLVLLRIPDKT